MYNLDKQKTTPACKTFNQRDIRIKMKKLLIIIFFINFSCLDKQDNPRSDFKTLFLADCMKDLNVETDHNCENYLDDYYLKKDSLGKDSIATTKHYFGLGVFLQKEIVDSLYKNLPSILFHNENNNKFSIDTTTYISSPNLVSGEQYKKPDIKATLKKYIGLLVMVQDSLRSIQTSIEAYRIGPKKEKIVCQLSRQNIFFTDIEKSSSNAGLFLETEKQFNIIYRELECTLFSISMVYKWKSANNHYKIRI